MQILYGGRTYNSGGPRKIRGGFSNGLKYSCCWWPKKATVIYILTPSVKMHDLGAVFGTEMTMVDHVIEQFYDHVNAICRSVCHQIRNIGRIRCFLSRDTCKQTVHASVTSRPDFCNALLAGLPDLTVGKLQRCQNMAARAVTRTRKCDHITPVLRELHWLPVVDRVHFKVLLQVYKAFALACPASYLVDPIQLYQGVLQTQSCTAFCH